MSGDEIPIEIFQRQTSARWFGLGWFAVYAVISMLIQWPLVGSMTTHISYGHEREITVPMLNLWTVWWNADRAADGLRGYWNAPIFFPTEKTFVFSEAQPTSIIVAPILGLTGNRGLAYNVYQLLILTLNGFSAHQLFRRLGHIPWLAFCGGFMSQILPFVMWQFGVVQLTSLFGIYWTIHAVIDLWGVASHPSQLAIVHYDSEDRPQAQPTSPRHRRFGVPVGVRLGLAYGVTYWACNYWGLFLTLLLLPSSTWFVNHQGLQRSFWQDVLIAFVISLAMIGPFAWLQQSQSREHHWSGARTPDMVRDLSAHWRDHTDLPWRTFASSLEFPEKDRNNVWPLGGGGLKTVLIPVGLIAAVLKRQRRRWGLFAISFGAIAFGLSLGPTICLSEKLPVLGGFCPYELLQKYVPGFSLIRSPFRFAVFVQLAIVWLTVEALDLLNPSRWIGQRILDANPAACGRPTISSIFRLLPLLVTSIVIAVEAVPPVTKLYELPSQKQLPTWVRWLRFEAEPNTAIACLPFPVGSNAENYEDTAVWMYWSTFHHHPLVNGYSGFFPDSFIKMKEGLEQFERPDDLDPNELVQPLFKHYALDNPGLQELNACPIRYVVVKRSFGTRDDVWEHPATRFRWVLVATDEVAGVDIYQITAPNEASP